MRSGRLRHVVILQRQSSTQDDYGQRIDTWATIATVRANIIPMKGSEYIAARGEQANTTSEITIRNSTDVDGVRPRDRVNHDGDLYDIQAVMRQGKRGRALVMVCERLYDD